MSVPIQFQNPVEFPDRTTVHAGDLVLLSGADRKPAVVRMQLGLEYQTHHGVLAHDNVIGRRWGESVQTHLGFAYTILPPSLDEMIRDVHRATQIIYPKEIGYMLMKMNIGPGTHVLEAGTGSGGLTLALARMVQPDGHVYSYEVRPDIQATAVKNLERVGLDRYVTFKVRNAEEGFDEQALDAAILDVREPWLLLQQTHAVLRGGGFLCSLVPTVNQVGVLLRNFGLRSFGFAEVEELLVRPYKPVSSRLRPVDRMIAHTGYLVFARALIPGVAVPAPEFDGSDDDLDDAGDEDQADL